MLLRLRTAALRGSARMRPAAVDSPNGYFNLPHMRATWTISLPLTLRKNVSRAAKRQQMNDSEFVLDAVRRRLALDRFRGLRDRAVAQAQARGIYTDEDVFKIVS